MRLNSKVAEPLAEPPPFDRQWRYVNRYGIARKTMPSKDKVTAWYESDAAMLDELPLSREATVIYDARPPLSKKPTFSYLRPLISGLGESVGHSFRYKDTWKSLSADAMATYYEDKVLHMVGEQRMKDWWAQQDASKTSLQPGAALTFWYQLDGSSKLPDAIVEGLKSTVNGEFHAVYVLTYQHFDNMPAHIRVIDCNKVLPKDRFLMVLEHGTSLCQGFIAVLAEWIKQVAAAHLEEARDNDAITTFDGDSLWLSRAVPPLVVCGHASATLALNPVSRQNFNLPKRLETLTYEYCTVARDFKRIATPLRWPRGSPALKSLVRRIKPMVTPYGQWRGGENFDVVMDTMWDTYNNWGLRKAFNDPTTHSAVPWFSWSKPCEAGSVNHPQWGLRDILTLNPVCVNAMWQTSKTSTGPSYRSSLAWHETSLVSALVEVARVRAKLKSQHDIVIKSITALLSKARFLTTDCLVSFAVVNKDSAEQFPGVVVAMRTIVRLKQLVFARCVGDYLDMVGLGIHQKFSVAGYAMELLSKVKVDTIMDDPAPWVIRDARAAALAILFLAASSALDYHAERAVHSVVRGAVSSDQWSVIHHVHAKLVHWLGRP